AAHPGHHVARRRRAGRARRHNVLFDLEAGGLALWTAGDAALQRTRGKNWFWELGGTPVLATGLTGPDLALVVAGRELAPRLQEQFVTEVDAWQTAGARLLLRHRLTFAMSAQQKHDPKAVTLQVQPTLAPLPGTKT